MLTLHRTQSAHLPHQPGQHFIVLGSTVGVADLVVGIVVVSEIQHDGTRLEDTETAILQGGDATVRVDGKVPLLLLGILGNVDGLYLILKTEFLKYDGWFVTIGCAEGIESQIVIWW